MDYLTVKWLHILSSTFLFGTGIGSAFYLLFASISRDSRAIAVVTRTVVLADWIFTTTTAILQPLTGFYLIKLAGYPMSSTWIRWSVILYLLALACWLPVVWIQIRMRGLAREAVEHQLPLSMAYWRHFWIWVALGVPAFFAFVMVFYLMVTKPI
ncbi:DUF2269 family protein [Noviherbaspirillum denitrificans]|uniref:DUF2269 domain-containing protein n=1 Tax=Noviherbaspirillum denitrificans TaxID=1968433 RepID=A0A254TBX2_9BURK|nr:DUF2269 domain-containing protein [Noviherbaspirillum denitrificans]OWW20141.1 hypothetical protein AYR66_12190 [Noviherbaspirillum denitrificans]